MMIEYSNCSIIWFPFFFSFYLLVLFVIFKEKNGIFPIVLYKIIQASCFLGPVGGILVVGFKDNSLLTHLGISLIAVGTAFMPIERRLKEWYLENKQKFSPQDGASK